MHAHGTTSSRFSWRELLWMTTSLPCNAVGRAATAVKPRKCLRTIANCESVMPSVMSSPACTVCFLFVPLQIPVACKSCPCGYVFISRKLLNAKLNERSSPAIAGIAWGQRNLTKVIYLLFCLHHFVWLYVKRNKSVFWFILYGRLRMNINPDYII